MKQSRLKSDNRNKNSCNTLLTWNQTTKKTASYKKLTSVETKRGETQRMKVRPISHHVSERLQPNSGTLLKRLIDLTTKCEVVNADVPAQRAGTKEARDRTEASEKAPYLRNPPLRRPLQLRRDKGTKRLGECGPTQPHFYTVFAEARVWL